MSVAILAISRLRHAARRRPHADIAIAAVLYAVTLMTMTIGPAPWQGGLSIEVLSAAALACGALIVRRRRPFPVLVVSTVAAEVYLAFAPGHDGTLIIAAPLIALYTVADLVERRRALAVGGIAVILIAGAHIMLKRYPWAGAESLALVAFGGLAVAAGDASRSRRAYVAEVEERARRAEHDRQQETWRQLTEERLRIARDLHDSVGHHLALINVQAGVAGYVMDEQSAQVRQTLARIRTESGAALTELRDTVGLLRRPGEPVTPTEPASGLAGLDDLLASFRRSGMPVEHDIEGAARPLPRAIDLTAYRVIQESLTNVCKHARDATTVTLRLSYRSHVLRIVLDDNAASTAALGADDDGGHGIVGMRERVSAVGGDLRAGPRPAGGFRVVATLPLHAGDVA